MSEHRVDNLHESAFDSAATWARNQLGFLGYAFIDLQPGDATTYKIVIARPVHVGLTQPTVDRASKHLWVGTSFGPLYQWNPDWPLEWGYVYDHWLPRNRSSDEWTARVLARFLNTLSDKLKEG